jgi:hypothetical protein
MSSPLTHPGGHTCPQISRSFLGMSALLGSEVLAFPELVESAARESFVLAFD